MVENGYLGVASRNLPSCTHHSEILGATTGARAGRQWARVMEQGCRGWPHGRALSAFETDILMTPPRKSLRKGVTQKALGGVLVKKSIVTPDLPTIDPLSTMLGELRS